MDALAPLTLVLDLGRRYTLHLANAGLACCAVEVVAASVGDSRLLSAGATATAGLPDVEVLVVSGTVTDKIAPAVRALYDRMPEPRRVVSFGACASSGGPYWDSYCVVKGVDTVLPVDLYVPGCPPRPEALLHALLQLGRQATGPREAAAPRRSTAPRHSTAPPVRPAVAVSPQDLRRRLPGPPP